MWTAQVPKRTFKRGPVERLGSGAVCLLWLVRCEQKQKNKEENEEESEEPYSNRYGRVGYAGQPSEARS